LLDRRTMSSVALLEAAEGLARTGQAAADDRLTGGKQVQRIWALLPAAVLESAAHAPVDGGLGTAAVGSRRVATIVLRRVLIVDDNTALAENIAEILQLAGHATQVAASAEEAFPKGLENEPDVVVTDFRLPGISGAVFVRQFLATRTHIRAMVISAYTDDQTIEEATAAGAAFMPKPLDFMRLSRWVGDAFA
jgi:CheY-like chemotaxis protein